MDGPARLPDLLTSDSRPIEAWVQQRVHVNRPGTHTQLRKADDAPEIGIGEITGGEISASQIGASKVGTGKLSAREIRAYQGGVSEVGAVEAGASDRRSHSC
jgi:hypothetical protein